MIFVYIRIRIDEVGDGEAKKLSISARIDSFLFYSAKTICLDSNSMNNYVSFERSKNLGRKASPIATGHRFVHWGQYL
jgi:hypothetical protein